MAAQEEAVACRAMWWRRQELCKMLRLSPEASAADVERRLRIGAAAARDVFGAAARALLDQRIGGPDGLT